MINFNNPDGWSRYKEISDQHADKIEDIVRNSEDVKALERKINMIDIEIQVLSFGIIWKTQGQGKTRPKV